MNKNQKYIAFTFAALVAASFVFAPHNADHTGDVVFRPLGTKESIPYRNNEAERKVVEEAYNRLSQDPTKHYGGLSIDQFSRRLHKVTQNHPNPNNIDFTAGFYGWPYPNYTMLTGYWVTVVLFTGIGLLATRDNDKKPNK